MSRLDWARIAGIKAGHAGLSLAGTVVASDACRGQRGVAMVYSGVRHFRH